MLELKIRAGYSFLYAEEPPSTMLAKAQKAVCIFFVQVLDLLICKASVNNIAIQWQGEDAKYRVCRVSWIPRRLLQTFDIECILN